MYIYSFMAVHVRQCRTRFPTHMINYFRKSASGNKGEAKQDRDKLNKNI